MEYWRGQLGTATSTNDVQANRLALLEDVAKAARAFRVAQQGVYREKRSDAVQREAVNAYYARRAELDAALAALDAERARP